MVVLALAPIEITIWQVALAVGLVVIIVVIALLGLLLQLVRNIEAGADKVLDAAVGVAGNTGKIKIALTVADTLEKVAHEAGRHAKLLGVGAR